MLAVDSFFAAHRAFSGDELAAEGDHPRQFPDAGCGGNLLGVLLPIFVDLAR